MKFEDLPKMSRFNQALEVENGFVGKVSIDMERCLTAWLHVDFSGGGCGFGGYVLGKHEGNLLAHGGDYAAEFLVRCMATVGSETWEGIQGKPIRVLSEGLGGGIIAIGHFLKDKWFCPSIEFEKNRGLDAKGPT